MNTAAGPVTASPLQAALQIPSDPAVPATSGDFTAALAAACVADAQSAVPEGMQSAAALAWLAGIVSAVQPVQANPEVLVPVDSGALPSVDEEASPEIVPDSALVFLQGMLASAAPVLPRESVEKADVPVVAEVAAARPLVVVTPDLAAIQIPNIPQEAIAARFSAAPVPESLQTPEDSETVQADVIEAGFTAEKILRPAPLPAAPAPVLLRALVLEQQPDDALPLPVDGRAATTVVTDKPTTSDAPVDKNVAERLIGALADHFSTRTDGAATHADTDRSVVSGPNLYVSTREVVAASSGEVSSRPEVVRATVGSPRWANELGSRLAMMTVRGQQEGSLSLTPEHLGPLEVRISVNQDTTNVWFGAQHADTRAALAEALPRLREMFAASGLALGQAGVSHETPGQEARRSQGSALRSEGMPETTEVSPVRAARISTGLLDTWA